VTFFTEGTCGQVETLPIDNLWCGYATFGAAAFSISRWRTIDAILMQVVGGHRTSRFAVCVRAPRRDRFAHKPTASVTANPMTVDTKELDGFRSQRRCSGTAMMMLVDQGW